MTDYCSFYQLLHEADRKKLLRVEAENAKLWAHMITLLGNISCSPFDGSGFMDIHRLGEVIAEDLRSALEIRQ